MLNNNRRCRVCGFENAEAPWGEDGATPSFNICDCCGVEFGYEDATAESVKRYRKRWLEQGATWFQPERRPRDWDLQAQQLEIPLIYRDQPRKGEGIIDAEEH